MPELAHVDLLYMGMTRGKRLYNVQVVYEVERRNVWGKEELINFCLILMI